MKEQLISFNTAKLAKEKGFNIPMYTAYIGGKFFESEAEPNGYDGFNLPSKKNWNKKDWVFTRDGESCLGCKLDNVKYFEACSVTTQSSLQKWLRENHGIHIVITPTVTGYWIFKILAIQLDPNNVIEKPSYKNVDSNGYQTYEQVLEKALYQALKLIK